MALVGQAKVAELLRSLRAAGAVVVVGFCLVAIVMLALDVKSRLRALERASSDNSQWVMMQTEVEVLRLQTAVLTVLEKEPPHNMRDALSEVRRWFNVLYSRVSMLEQSPVYAPLLQRQEYLDSHGVLRGFLDSEVEVIDGSDAQLAAALPEFAARLPNVRSAARELTLKALADFAAESDMQRGSMSDTLVRLAILTGALILMLGGLAVVMAQLYRLSVSRAEELRSTGARLSTVIAASADGIIVADAGGGVVEFNPAAQQIFGIPREGAIGRDGLDLMLSDGPGGPQRQTLRGVVASLRQGHAPVRLEIDARRADGQAFPAEVTMALAQVSGGSLLVIFVRDISERRRAQRDLTDALDRAVAGEKAKAEFLAVMSHEMRTPLNGLIGSMDLLNQTALDDNQRELLTIMAASGDILLGHVNSVLDISKAEAGAIRIVEAGFDLDRLIDEVAANQSGLAAAKGTTVSVTRLSGALGEVMGDQGRIRQILLNLVGNAVKFTSGGSVSIETELLGRGDGNGLPIEIRVIDTGIGISEANLTRIFEDFVTLDASYGRAQNGTGLGLGIARRLAHAMGGEIGAESEEGEGSLFWLRLTLRRAQAPQEAASDPPEAGEGTEGGTEGGTEAGAAAGAPLDVLVVEDNEINRFLLRRYLETAGHRVTEAVDGMAGVEMARARGFDAILMDISMPRLDGVEATRMIRASGGPSSGARIFALTAHALPEEQVRFRAAGMETGLTKPIDRLALLARLSGVRPATGDGPGGDGAALPIVNDVNLRELVEQIGAEMAASLIRRLMAEGADTVQRIAAMTGTDDRAEMARLAHQLAGTCGTFGTTRLREVLSGIETAIKRGNEADMVRHRAEMGPVWQATHQALEEEVTRLDMVAS